MDSTIDIAENLSAQIDKTLAELPEQMYALLTQEVASDTPVGCAIRQDDGEAFKDYLGRLSPHDYGAVVERFIHVGRALQGSDLMHTPDFESLARVADGAAGLSEESPEKFYQALQTVAQVIPGRDADGTVVSRYQLYQQSTSPEPSGFDVVAQAKDALADPNTPDEEREHWSQLIRDNVPSLSTQAGDILPEMIPDSDMQVEAASSAQGFNDTLGRAAGEMLYTLTGSSHPQRGDNSDASFLTDPSVTEDYRNLMAGASDVDAESES